MTDSSVTETARGETGLPRLVDIEEIATHLGVTVRHVRRLVAERRIPFVRWGHLLRFDPAEITAWLNGARISTGNRDAQARGQEARRRRDSSSSSRTPRHSRR